MTNHKRTTLNKTLLIRAAIFFTGAKIPLSNIDMTEVYLIKNGTRIDIGREDLIYVSRKDYDKK